MEWWEETLHNDWRQRLRVREVLYREQTEHQDLVIFDNPVFGRVLALDGALQTTENDAFIYHETIVHTPIVAHGAAREVLIVGGGDGGSLREALRHEGVRRVTQVELDASVIELSKKHLPSLSRGAFDDPRTRLILGDGARFMAESEERFDVIVVDSTDPLGPGAALFSEGFYRDCRARLSPGGILSTQWGNPFVDGGKQLGGYYARMKAHFEDAYIFAAAVPTYIGGVMAFGWGCDDPEKRRLGAEELARRPLPAGLRHYTPAVHAASFVQPPWLLAYLGLD